MEANFVRNTNFNHDCLRRECKMDLKFWERETSKAKSIKIWNYCIFFLKSRTCVARIHSELGFQTRVLLFQSVTKTMFEFLKSKTWGKTLQSSKSKICWKHVLIHALLEKAILLLQSDFTLLGRVCSRAHRPLLRCEKQSKSETKSLQKQHI